MHGGRRLRVLSVQVGLDFLLEDVFADDAVMGGVRGVVGVAVVDGLVRGVGLEDGVKFCFLGLVAA